MFVSCLEVKSKRVSGTSSGMLSGNTVNIQLIRINITLIRQSAPEKGCHWPAPMTQPADANSSTPPSSYGHLRRLGLGILIDSMETRLAFNGFARSRSSPPV